MQDASTASSVSGGPGVGVVRLRRGFWGDFREFFFRGLGILLPSVITLALLWWAAGFLWVRVAEPINRAVRWGVVQGAPLVLSPKALPGWYTVTEAQVEAVRTERIRLGQAKAPTTDAARMKLDDTIRYQLRMSNLSEIWKRRFYLQPIGLVVAVILIYLAGLLVGNYLGRKIWFAIEKRAIRFPVIKQVYPSIKQIVEFMLGGGPQKNLLSSGRVVAVPYPRAGIWTVGLMTGETLMAIEDKAGVPCVTVFIPSTPTPFTGFTITVPAAEVVELPLSFDDAIRFVVSGGVLVPPSQSRSTIAASKASNELLPAAKGGDSPLA